MVTILLVDRTFPPVEAADAITSITRELADSDNNFKRPSELDFPLNSPPNSECTPLLTNNEKNKPFNDQVYKLNVLQARLEGISTCGDKQLENKHEFALKGIQQILQSMEEHKLKLYKNFIAEAPGKAESAMDDIRREYVTCVERFKCPTELDFLRGSENDMRLLNNAKNMPFINHVRQLDEFRARLAEIHTYGDEQLNKKRKLIDMYIERALQSKKDHQSKLYEKPFSLPKRRL
ncbi:hypothetical protein FRC11_008931 [Ceratobasidium sp. 423]|nr:hypothetical protein FRC11_008931 [Ceratobasidium sp. 423]